MNLLKIALKITLAISLLINSAGQGYALRPQAAAYSTGLGEELREGFKIIVQSGLGAGVGRPDEYTDDDYSKAGAEVVPTREEVWKRAHLILKVKEPLIEGGINEFELMKGMARPEAGRLVIGVVCEVKPDEGRAALLPDGVRELIKFAKEINFSQSHKGRCDIFNMLFTYYHFAASRKMTESVLDTGCSALTLEAIVGDASSAALFTNPEWINSEGAPGRIVVPRIVKLYKEALGKTLPCLDPMSIVAGIEAVLQGVVYLDEDKVRINEGRVEVEDGWPGCILDHYPDSPDMSALKGRRALITGAGAAGLSALWQARRLGAKVIISDIKKNLPLLSRILSEDYGSSRVTTCDSKDEIDELLKGHDIVIIDGENRGLIKQAMTRSSLMVGAALKPTEEAPKTIIADIIREVCDSFPMRRLMVDIARDQGGNFDFVNSAGELITGIRPTYHHDPVRIGYKDTIYYMVGNMPGRPGVVAKASSRMLQAARLPYIKELIQFGLLQAVKIDSGLKAGLSVIQGELTDERVSETKGFGFNFTPVEKALEGIAAVSEQIPQGHMEATGKSSSAGDDDFLYIQSERVYWGEDDFAQWLRRNLRREDAERVFSSMSYEARSKRIVDILNDEDRDKKERLRIITGHLLALGIKKKAKELAAGLLKSTALIRIDPRICTPVTDNLFVANTEMLILFKLASHYSIKNLDEIDECRIIDKTEESKKITLFFTVFVTPDEEYTEKTYRLLLKIARATGSKNYRWYKDNKESVTEQLWAVFVAGNTFIDPGAVREYDEDVIRMCLVHELWHSQMLRYYYRLKGTRVWKFEKRMKKFVELSGPVFNKMAELTSCIITKSSSGDSPVLFYRFSELAAKYTYPPVLIGKFEARLRSNGKIVVYSHDKPNEIASKMLTVYRNFVYLNFPFMVGVNRRAIKEANELIPKIKETLEKLEAYQALNPESPQPAKIEISPSAIRMIDAAA